MRTLDAQDLRNISGGDGNGDVTQFVHQVDTGTAPAPNFPPHPTPVPPEESIYVPGVGWIVPPIE